MLKKLLQLFRKRKEVTIGTLIFKTIQRGDYGNEKTYDPFRNSNS